MNTKFNMKLLGIVLPVVFLAGKCNSASYEVCGMEGGLPAVGVVAADDVNAGAKGAGINVDAPAPVAAAEAPVDDDVPAPAAAHVDDDVPAPAAAAAADKTQRLLLKEEIKRLLLTEEVKCETEEGINCCGFEYLGCYYSIRYGFFLPSFSRVRQQHGSSYFLRNEPLASKPI